MEQLIKVEGEVKTWLNTKGFGFIKVQDYGEVFFHQKNVVSKQEIYVGRKVLLSIKPSSKKKGEFEAVTIEFIEDNNNLFAEMKWFNGNFGVAEGDRCEYFVHSKETHDNLDEKDLILFSPQDQRGKDIATRVILIESYMQFDLIFDRILSAYEKASSDLRYKLMKYLTVEKQRILLESYIKRNALDKTSMINCFRTGIFKLEELPPLEINDLVDSLDIILNEKAILNLKKDEYDEFLEKYLVVL
jgi:cold shock CspA family protein